ncbi:stemmadenine O-acetyltransferase-like [Tripterygium wilfordii]|uniref:stemmadenine O-acetyltransferase-like n=1 Tax=Tripterygium wilfordii TaxID=458696 RepID=UPI0018F81204|nr:stemmadenine O-acetyltransferase-like [Tripterygium wilfordii]
MATTATLKVDVIARETIKPSSPTPTNLKTFKFSLLDQITPTLYLPLLLFYPTKGEEEEKQLHRIQLLKSSLSKILRKYYPFAGRIKDHNSIDCNDEGVMFVEARTNYNLSNLLQQPDLNQLKQLLPIESIYESSSGNLLLVQVTFLKCGGMAIAVCLSHKLADATTLSTFTKNWASAGEVVDPELFVGSTLFPPVDHAPPSVEIFPSECLYRRLIFDASKITTLKAEAASTVVQQPTRVEAITALLLKCAMSATRSTKGSSRPSLCIHAANIRKRYSPPVSEYAIGNLIRPIITQIGNSEIELQSLVCLLREKIKEFSVTGEAEKVLGSVNEAKPSFGETNMVDTYGFSSWCRMPLYAADFGWGKPIWVALTNSSIPNVFILVDTRDGDGIEAWVYLNEEEMAAFESDQELLRFASVNPSVIF